MVNDFNELNIELLSGEIIRFPLMTKLGSLQDLCSLSEAVGILPPQVRVAKIPLNELISIIKFLIKEGHIKSEIIFRRNR